MSGEAQRVAEYLFGPIVRHAASTKMPVVCVRRRKGLGGSNLSGELGKDYDKAIELKSDYAEAYNNRAVAHCRRKAYDKARADVKMCRKLGGTPNPELIEDLTRFSGRSE